MYSVRGALWQALGIQDPQGFYSGDYIPVVETDHINKNKIKISRAMEKITRVMEREK